MSRVTVNEQYLQDTADAIREKTGENDTYKPSLFANAINNISTGSEKQLYVFTSVTGYLSTDASSENKTLNTFIAYFNSLVIEGATITFRTYDDYILDNITGQESGNTISFTTVSRGKYTFIMPNESVYCELLYDD